MAHHHKSNKQVEQNPDTGHSRGMPRRPDEEELDERTREDRDEVREEKREEREER
ncbi:hypothetical protein K7472_10435 [Streptomyces sp. PTM05]|uniref:Uncharacterized protein n=1 Tax=Streptantibioticus parmotrematis TaxID=2873249 RepID=A0ABS7QPZ1_9ACTN|nr:hypothetical protein [Streptantibioticus parmotrematis]MBY8885262.1 hypothetical protein [Streptantibioticus parmotrematis]